MHNTAQITGEAFFKYYGFPRCSVLEVGSLDINGSIRPFAPEGCDYTGIDMEPGPGVDLVVEQHGAFPFDPESFNLVVSTSSFEHDSMFWVTFLEMARVAKPGGFLYISAPSNGPVHRHPVDCWRFLPDSPNALAEWASHSTDISIDVVESFRMFPSIEGWIDQVCVFGKRPWTERERTIRNAILQR